MRRDDFALATMTLVRDAAEERRITRSLTALAARGIAMFAADGGSPDDFVTGLSALAHVTLVPTDGRELVAQVRGSLRRVAASGARRVRYSEPDKLEVLEHRHDPLAWVVVALYRGRTRRVGSATSGSSGQ